MSRSGRDRAYAHLKDSLLYDPDLPGTFISEAKVANDAGVSRTPVREALLMLAAEDLVQLVPHRGAFVPALTPGQIREVLQARDAIETWAIRTAMGNGNVPVAAMAECLQRQRAESTDRGFIEADREFHTILINAADNSVMNRMYDVLRARHVHIGVAALTTSTSRRDAVLREHQLIVDTLESGSLERAVDAMSSHLQTTLQNLVGSH